MASILPDDVLSKLLCSICKKYLSCAPTKIHRNGNVTCGRCTTNEAANPNSLYEKVSKFSFFPCVNRYEGCNKLLRYEDVSQHEKICETTLFSCPACTFDQFKQISSLYLIDHYKAFHRDYFLKEPKFFIDPNIISDNTYLYLDNYNNCLFVIKVVCTQDRLFLNACVSNKKVVQRFKLNDVLQEPNTIMLCSAFGDSEICVDVKVANIIDKQDKNILCEFLYDIIERTAPVVAIDLSSVEEPAKKEQTFSASSTLPKMYLDSKYFPEKQKYKLSPCKSKLMNEMDSNFTIKLKCDSCDMYFWNISEWETIKFELDNRNHLFDYGVYRRKIKDLEDLICLQCFKYLLHYDKSDRNQLCTPTATAPILNLRFYCRFNCRTICFVWELHTHEKDCEFNLKPNSEDNVKKCFSEDSYNADDLFITGNFVKPFKFEVASYPFGIFGPNPKIQKPQDVTSLEKVIYLFTDDGLKCKIYYKYVQGNFNVRIDHDYDKSRYFVRLCMGGHSIDDPVRELMYSEKSEYVSIGRCMPMIKKDKDGVVQYVNATPCFVVILKEISSHCNVTL